MMQMKLVPLHQKPYGSEFNNRGPISLFTNVLKVGEKIIHIQLYALEILSN